MSTYIRSSAELWAFSGGANEDDNIGGKLKINVVFTDRQGTIAALRTAGLLADQLRARVDLLVAQIVPLPFSLTSPPVPIGFTQEQLLKLVNQSNAAPIEVLIDLYLCRDRLSCILEALRPQSLVIVGARRWWWSNRETRLLATLQRAGHHVIVPNLRAEFHVNRWAVGPSVTHNPTS